MGPLLGLGIGFITDLISKHGEKLVTAGVEKVTGIDLSKTELTAEDKQKIMDAEIRLKELDFEAIKEANRHKEFDVIETHKNTANARDLQKEALKQEDKFSKRYVYYLATFWSAVASVYLFMITFGDIPVDNQRFADTILGFLLGTIISTIINFFMGSADVKDK